MSSLQLAYDPDDDDGPYLDPYQSDHISLPDINSDRYETQLADVEDDLHFPVHSSGIRIPTFDIGPRIIDCSPLLSPPLPAPAPAPGIVHLSSARMVPPATSAAAPQAPPTVGPKPQLTIQPGEVLDIRDPADKRPTVRIEFSLPDGTPVRALALADLGSDACILDTRVAQALKVPYDPNKGVLAILADNSLRSTSGRTPPMPLRIGKHRLQYAFEMMPTSHSVVLGRDVLLNLGLVSTHFPPSFPTPTPATRPNRTPGAPPNPSPPARPKRVSFAPGTKPPDPVVPPGPPRAYHGPVLFRGRNR